MNKSQKINQENTNSAKKWTEIWKFVLFRIPTIKGSLLAHTNRSKERKSCSSVICKFLCQLFKKWRLQRLQRTFTFLLLQFSKAVSTDVFNSEGRHTEPAGAFDMFSCSFKIKSVSELCMKESSRVTTSRATTTTCRLPFKAKLPLQTLEHIVICFFNWSCRWFMQLSNFT